MMAPTVPPTAAPMIAPLAVEPFTRPIMAPAAPPTAAPVTAPFALLLCNDEQATSVVHASANAATLRECFVTICANSVRGSHTGAHVRCQRLKESHHFPRRQLADALRAGLLRQPGHGHDLPGAGHDKPRS